MTGLATLMPDPLASDRQWERYHHRDIAAAETDDLVDELHAIRSGMWFLRSESSRQRIGRYEQARRIDWFRSRMRALESELQRRRYAPSNFRSQSKPRLARGVKL